ncbi:MAG: TIGR03085 family metal-binding protein [Actinomycetia bacterium]|nr:TIGR03085 family metal-binding protein [Actinomycetes bacterium]
MTQHAVAAREREQICATFLALGPDAPTLCSPWRTRHLAAHLVVREHRPDLAAGMYVPILSERLERHQDELAERTSWTDLVERVRQGPPTWHPTQIGAIDEAVNALEFFIHHEDVLRAQPGAHRRVLDDETEAGVWVALKRMAKVLFRKVDAGLVLAAPGHGRIAVKAPTKKGSVTLTAAPGELALLGFGRRDQADVDARGSRPALEALSRASLGI